MGAIIHLDDDQQILEGIEGYYNQRDIDLDYITCQTKEEFISLLEKKDTEVRCIIFDLLSEEPDKEELQEEDADFLDFVKKSFADYNLPIFIYSGYLPAVEGIFDEYGTVFKVDKDKKDGTKEIFDRIKLFHESGFLEVFCPGGKIEKEIHKELHQAFISQFTDNTQIESIINQISEDNGDTSDRVERVFKRIAISSLLSGLKAPKTDESGEVQGPELLHPVEHYMQRISPFEFWTGDILKKEDNGEYLLIITPRCNIFKSTELLVCDVDVTDFPKSEDAVKRALRDNPDISGYDRYLAPSAFFEGGRIKFSTHRSIDKTTLSADYSRIISLSPELTNEILGKFGAYFFRTGITPWHGPETMAHIKEANDG